MSDSEEEPTAVMITIRLMPLAGKSAGQPEEHNVKVGSWRTRGHYYLLVVETSVKRSQLSWVYDTVIVGTSFHGPACNELDLVPVG